MRLAISGAIIGGAAVAAALFATPVGAQERVLVFAAASLRNALDEVVASAPSAHAVTVSYAGSAALAQQIEQGAPADLFISADLAWMDYLAERDLIEPDSRANLVGNTLVLIAPADSTAAIAIGPGFDLAGLIGDGRLAMADPAAVPAGRYARQALEFLGVWPAVAAAVAPTDNVRAALALVAAGEAPAGIVYATDAVADPTVRVLGAFPAESHEPIVYPVALTADSANPAAAAFLGHLQSDEAGEIFARHGFSVLD